MLVAVETALMMFIMEMCVMIMESAVAPAMQASGQKMAFRIGSFASVTVSNLVRLQARLMSSVTKTHMM